MFLSLCVLGGAGGIHSARHPTGAVPGGDAETAGRWHPMSRCALCVFVARYRPKSAEVPFLSLLPGAELSSLLLFTYFCWGAMQCRGCTFSLKIQRCAAPS